MRGKILDSLYNPGYDSWVLKQTKYGIFDGEARLHPHDEDIDNSFDGCKIAEFRADLKSCKEKAKWMRQRAIGARIVAQSCWRVLEDTEAEAEVEKIVAMLEKQADDTQEYYKRMKAYEPMFIKNLLQERRETREMINKRKA